MTRRFSRSVLAFVGSLLLIALIYCFLRPSSELEPPISKNSPVSGEISSQSIGPVHEVFPDEVASVDFEKWSDDFRKVPESAAIANGIALAQRRKERMLQLIRTNPKQAIEESLGFDGWLALPEEVRVLVERPFSELAEFNIYPVCVPEGTVRPAGLPDSFSELILQDGARLESFTYGQRAAMGSKRRLPVQGITLGGIAAIRDEVFQKIGGAEVAAARTIYPTSESGIERDFVTGNPVGAKAVYAIAGGKIHAFSNEEALAGFEEKMSVLDALPGPNAGSGVIFMEDFNAGEANGFNLAGAQAYGAAQASAWTESKKKVFLIRVNFLDSLAEPVTRVAASNELNGATSDLIRAMSYGKTWIEGTVSANTYSLPKLSTFYADKTSVDYGGINFTSKSTDLIRDARNTFRTGRSGGDASINIGPVNNTGNGDASGLGDYDIVGVYFGNIGMYGNGLKYAGLAGAGNLWVQDTNTTSLYVHELGHNYGLGHAGFWQTTDGSVVGTGYTVEYGDSFDIMGSGSAPEGHYNPQAKSLLNWLTTSEWKDASVLGSQTYRIYREDDSATTGNPRGVRVTKSAGAGNKEYYWIGYKPAFSKQENLTRGAYLIWQRKGESLSMLLDTTPATNGVKSDAPISLGRTYADTVAGLFITPLGVGGTGSEKYIDVRVNIGSFPGNQPPAAGTITGPSTVVARTPTVFTVNATDQNSDPLAFSWEMNDDVIQDSAASISHSWTTGGTYQMSVTVSDMKGGTIKVNKTVTVTDPLDTWKPGSIGVPKQLRDLVWGKGRFIAAEYFGTVFQSWDGITWSKVGDPPAFENTPVLAFGNDVFVMGGKIKNANSAQLVWSPDGRLWKTASFPAGIPQIRKIAFGGGKFIAVADSGTVLNSVDGKSWTLSTVTGAPDLRFVGYDGTTWAAIAMNAAAARPETVWTSLDGISWAKHGELGFIVYDLIGGENTLYATGWYGGIKFSTDHGITWQDAILPSGTRWTTDHIARTDDGTFLTTARAMDEFGNPYAWLVSKDGRTWKRTKGNGGNILISAGSMALEYGFGRFVSVETGGVTQSSNGMYPTNSAPVSSFSSIPVKGNARQGVKFSATASDSDDDPLVFAWDFGPLFEVGDGSASTHVYPFGDNFPVTLRVSDGRGGLVTLSSSINISDPAREFTTRNSGVTTKLQGTATNGTLAVAVGDGGKILSSTDGVTWTPRSIPEYAAHITFRGITWDGNRFVSVGRDYNYDIPVPGWVGLIYTSADGITWTQRYRASNGGTSLNAIAWTGGKMIAVGESGTILSSTDATTWTAVTIPGLGAPNVAGIAWGGGKFVITAYTPNNGTCRVFTSTNGLDWINTSTGVGVLDWQDLRKISWLNDRFVASGWYSSLRTSTDEGQTFTTTRPQTEQTPAMAFGDGIYFAAGVNHSNATADVDVLSLDGTNWYSFPAPTTADRQAAVFFKDTFITVGDNGEIWQSGNLKSSIGFSDWQLTNFPLGGEESLPTADPDHDGRTNLLEYALGANPRLAEANNDPTFNVVSGVAALRLNLPEPAMADITYRLEGNPTLTGPWLLMAEKTGVGPWSWLAEGAIRLSVADPVADRQSIIVRPPESADGLKGYFLRLSVEAP